MAIWSSRPRTLRARIALRIAAGTAAVLLAASLALDRVVEVRLESAFDRALLARAHALATLTEKSRDARYELNFADEVMPEFQRATGPDYFEVWVEGDAVLERSRSLAGADLPREARGDGSARFRDFVLPDGRAGRRVEVDFVPQDESRESDREAARPALPRESAAEPTATVVVATARAPLEASREDVRRTTALVFSALLVLLSGLGLWSVSAGLAPLSALGGQVAGLAAGDLARRVDLGDAPAEIAPLAERLNELLARIEAAFERERRLSKDLAHELRTPIAELRTLAEVAGRWPDDPETMRAFAADARAIALGMERVVGTLLSLARTEAGLERARAEIFDLGAVVAAIERRVAGEAAERGTRIDVALPAEPLAVGDPDRLELLLGNLIQNAVVHSPAGAQVAVAGRFEGRLLIVEVSNAAPELTPGDLPRMFERAWSKPTGRTAGRHAGLGLALTAALARSVTLEVLPRLEPGPRLVMSLALPRAPPRGPTIP